MEILHKITGAVLYSGEAKSLKELLERAVQEKADLSFAYLRGADLRKANLCNANLSFADLSGADLRFAFLCNTDLSGANLCDAKMDYQIQEGLHFQVIDIVTANPNCLEMSGWHTYETTHYLSSWACHLSPVAKELEKTHGTQIAGLLTLGAEAYSQFFLFLDNETALKNLQK